MKILKAMGLASGLVAAALVGGTLIGVVSASPSNTSDSSATLLGDETDVAAYCDQWRQSFADELGVSVDALTPAAKTATEAAIDAALANGDIPEDVAARMKEQLANADGDGCRLLGAGFHAWGRHAVRADWAHDWVGAAAETLDMTQLELVSELRDGSTLQQVAEAQGVDYDVVSQAILDAAETDLAALVDAGKITQERADTMLANLAERLSSGEFPPMRGPGGRGHGGDGPRGGFGGDGPFSG